MKIASIRAAAIDLTPKPTTQPRVPRQEVDGFVSPMARYPEFRARRLGDPLEAHRLRRHRRGRHLRARHHQPRRPGRADRQRPLRAGPGRARTAWRPRSCWDVMRRISRAVRHGRAGQLRDQRGRQRALGPEGQAARPPGLRAAGRPAEGEHPLLRQQHRPLVRRRAQHRLVPGARLQGGQALPARGAGGRHRGHPPERGAGRADPRAGRPRRRADGRRLDVAQRRVHRAAGRGAAALPRQVAGGLPAARGHWTAT